MLALRPYKPCDAESIVTWCEDEKTFLFWGGAHFGAFPISAQTMNDKYLGNNGDCVEPDNFYPMTAFDEDGIVGHLIMRYIKGNKKLLRFGWVIVDSKKRGHRYGSKMIQLALTYAFTILQVEKVTIGVYENNPSAYKCYLSAGFHKSEELPDSFADVLGEKCRIVELEIRKDEWSIKENGLK